MKIKYIIPVFLVVIVSGCNFLEIDPMDAVPSEDVFTDQKGLDGAMAGCYNALFSASIYQDAVLFADLAADNLLHIGSKQQYRQISDNLIYPDNSYVEGVWNNSYEGINRINNVIAGIDNVEGLSQEDKNLYLAQCYFLRAHFYFTLANYFGDVPLRRHPVTAASPEMLNISRTSSDEIYTFIISDLENAETLFSGQGKSNPSFAGEGSVKAFLARVYLYRGLWQSAADKALEVINMGYELEPEYSAIYDESSISNEIIFMINFYDDQNAINAIAEWTIPESRFEVAAWETEDKVSSIYDAFDPADARLSATVQFSNAGDAYYCAKYTDYGPDKDNVILFRLAEMYLIRAEALNEIDYEADGEAFDMLNAVRQRAELAELTSAELTNQEEFRLALENERRLELAFEGHRLHDLKRTGRINEVLPEIGNLRDANWLLPVPQSELDTNEDPGMIQNDGY